VVDLSDLGLRTRGLCKRKRGDARIIQAHEAFARRASQFLPAAS
jgi:hypothetical protein